MPKHNNKDKLKECVYCKNWWSINEGYNPKTKQCKGCDDYDKEEPARKAEAKRHAKAIKEMGNINFEYVAGDPFW